VPTPHSTPWDILIHLDHIGGARHSGTLRGNFTANGQNHGRPTYRKDCLFEGLLVESWMFVLLVLDNKWINRWNLFMLETLITTWTKRVFLWKSRTPRAFAGLILSDAFFFGTLILCWILHAWVGRGRVGQWRSFACDHLCVFQQARTSRIGVGWDAFGPCCLVERGLIFGESGEYIFSIIYIYTHIYIYIYIIYTLGIRNASLHTRVALQAFRPTGPDCQSRAGPAN